MMGSHFLANFTAAEEQQSNLQANTNDVDRSKGFSSPQSTFHSYLYFLVVHSYPKSVGFVGQELEDHPRPPREERKRRSAA